MTREMARCLEQSTSPGHFADLACDLLRRLGYRWQPDDYMAVWLALYAVKWRRKRWSSTLAASRIMARVYATGGYPPNLWPGAPWEMTRKLQA